MTKKNSYLVMETTGVYTEALSYFLYNNSYCFSVESALKVKKAFGIKINVDDWIASKAIAEYGIRFSDKLVQWQPPVQILDQVRTLLSLREHTIRERTAFKNRLHVLKKKIIHNNFIVKKTQELIETLTASINEIEKEIKLLLRTDTKLYSLYLIIISIPGVKMLLAANLMVLTDGFTKTVNHKEIASYLGICPNKKKSGTSVNTKAKSSGWGPKKLRKLVYLGACSQRQHNKTIKDYFERLLQKGKNKHLIINNISNKLIKIICGVVKSGKAYIKDYCSLSPALAA